MAFKVTPRKPQISYIIGSIVVLGLWFMIGSQILTAVADSLYCDASLFPSGSELIGLETNTSGSACATPVAGDVYTGEVTNTGLLDVLGLISAAAIFIMAFVKINF